MRICMKIGIAGPADGYDSINPGEVVEIPDDRARLWIDQKIAAAVAPDTKITGRLLDPAVRY